MATYVLGISCFYHDAAAALAKDGEIIAAALEERFTRIKHDFSFPRNAIRFCLERAGISARQLDYIVFYDKPFVKFERILFTAMATFPRGIRPFLQAMPLWLKQKLWVRNIIRKEVEADCPILFTEHHESHAASAFYCSPFERAAILTVDGVGEWATATMAVGEKNRVEIRKEIRFPNSLGLFYSAITYYLGFRVNDGEYKVMGLAPYGKPRYLEHMRELLSLHPDGSFSVNLRYFTYHYGLKMVGRKFERLFGQKRREPESPITAFHKDVAASAQAWLEEVLMAMVRKTFEETKQPYLCMAGGVALNCVANGRILREGPFRDLFVQPASSDAGGAVGAALFVFHHLLGRKNRTPLSHVFLGSVFPPSETEAFLKKTGVNYEKLEEEILIRRTADALAEQKIIGWFQGAAEFGPRALGNRSILADPRRAEMKDIINARVKHREAFRPFAPSVLEERAPEYFDLDRPSPYMLLVARVKKPEEIPAVTHVDGTARVQTVNLNQNPRYYRLLKAFEERTGCPVLLNTSFNVRGEPIVNSPEDAYRCYQQTDLDILVIDSFWIEDKSVQLPAVEKKTKRRMEEELWLS
jgi:carbamoyltransferase